MTNERAEEMLRDLEERLGISFWEETYNEEEED